ncbi:hypothetical protein Droror1_Dr00025390 [Drosera rotundifolia]
MGHRCATILTVHLPQPLILSAVDFISRHFERYFPSIYTQPAHSLLTFLPFTSATTAPRPLPPPPPPPPSLSQTQLNFVVILLNLIFFCVIAMWISVQICSHPTQTNCQRR